jgi:hypothetical protein
MKGGENDMENKSLFPLALYLVNDAHEREIRAAAVARLVARQPRPQRSVRRSVGQSLVRFGQRLAGEAFPETARSR